MAHAGQLAAPSALSCSPSSRCFARTDNFVLPAGSKLADQHHLWLILATDRNLHRLAFRSCQACSAGPSSLWAWHGNCCRWQSGVGERLRSSWVCEGWSKFLRFQHVLLNKAFGFVGIVEMTCTATKSSVTKILAMLENGPSWDVLILKVSLLMIMSIISLVKPHASPSRVSWPGLLTWGSVHGFRLLMSLVSSGRRAKHTHSCC